MSDTYTCVQCGDEFEERPLLEMHWTVEGHAPDDAQEKALDRARAGAEPEVVITNTVAQRRRGRLRVITGGRL